MRHNRKTIIMLSMTFFLGTGFLGACGDDNEGGDIAATGSVAVTANGEEFVRDGFISMDGWDLIFDHLYVNLTGPTAYQVVETQTSSSFRPLHAGHSHEDIPEGSAHVALTGSYLVDLAQGVEATTVGIITEAPIGNYNRLNFDITQAAADTQPVDPVTTTVVDDLIGYSIVLIGSAENGGHTITFTIKFTEEMRYTDCGPNATEGVVAEDGQGTAEMTFHFDHVFGDEETLGEADSVNEIALGFGPLAALSSGGVFDITQDDLGNLLSGSDYLTLIDALRTIGHSGEAHCHYSALE